MNVISRAGLIGIVGLLALLSACSKPQQHKPWEGTWQRTVMVPPNVQGRCVEETLDIRKREWKLTAVIHATYECNQPFLEMAYAGAFAEVKIRRDTADRDVRLQVMDIHLVAMADIGKTGRVPLSSSVVATLSAKYVPESARNFEHRLYLSEDGQSMQGDFYGPVQQLAIPEFPADAVLPVYQRLARQE